MTDRCAFWIASNNYLEEAERSVERFRTVMPDIETYLFFVGGNSGMAFTSFHNYHNIKPEHDLWYLNSTMAMNVAAEKLFNKNLLYFDTDTYLVEPVYDLFEMLEHGYDFIAAHAPGRVTAPSVNPIPDSYPEFNVGVCGFRYRRGDGELIQGWHLQYLAHQEVYGNNDQAPLREVLWMGNWFDKGDYPRVAVLPPEYNCRFGFGCFLRYPVKVLHGRHPDMAAVARSLNKNERSMRVWKPSDMG